MNTETKALLCQHLLQSRLLTNGTVIATIGVLGMIAAASWARQSRVASLCQDVDALNEQIGRFLVCGGSLSDIRGVGDVIDQLKFQGVGVNGCLEAEMQTAEQAATREPRAVWNPRAQRLAMRIDGGAGIRAINLSTGASTQVAA